MQRTSRPGGADVRRVQRLLGHRCLETTAVYTWVDVSDLRKVLASTTLGENACTAPGHLGEQPLRAAFEDVAGEADASTR